MKSRFRQCAALCLAFAALGSAIQAAGFTVVPAASKPGVLLRFIGLPPEADAAGAGFQKGFAGYVVERDGQFIGTVPLNPPAADLLKLRKQLYSDAEWTSVVSATNDLLAHSRLSPTSETPAEWVTAVKAAPAFAQGFEIQDWRAAVLLSRAFLDAMPPAGNHIYKVLGFAGGLLTRQITFPLTGAPALAIDPSVHTVVDPPPLWNVTPGLAHGLPSLQATDVPADGTDDPALTVHEWEEKANDGVYLKFAPPVAPLLPPGVSPGPRFIAFGYDVDRAVAAGIYLDTPPPAVSDQWKPINTSPALIVRTPAEVPVTPPPAVLESLKAEIPDKIAEMRVLGPQTLDTKKTILALQNWNASRMRPTAGTFRNTDFDFGDRGHDLIVGRETDPDPLLWGPKVRHWYRIRGRNGFGEDGQSSRVIRSRPFFTYRPMPPINVTAQKSGPNQITLQWQPPTVAPAGASRFTWLPPAGFRVYRWIDRPGYPRHPFDAATNPAGPGTLIAELPATAATLTDTGHNAVPPDTALAQGTTYWYRIVTIDASVPANESLPSGSAWAVLYNETAPGAPTGVTVIGVPCSQIGRGQGNQPVPPSSTVPAGTAEKCDCQYLAATPVNTTFVNNVTTAPVTGGASISWTASPTPGIGRYLVYRAPAVSSDPQRPCPNQPGKWEFVGEVAGASYVDPYRPTDPTPVYYQVRAIDGDKNVSPPAIVPFPILLDGTQPAPEPGFTGAKAVGPPTPPGPWHVDLRWEASVPDGAFYNYELWRSEVLIPASAALPSGLPVEANLQLLAQGVTGDPMTFFPVLFTDSTVVTGPNDQANDYWYVVVLKDPSGMHPDVRSKVQYVKVGGDVLEPEHKIVPFPWNSASPIQRISDTIGNRALLSWSRFPWQKLSWVDPTMNLATVLKAEGEADTALGIAAQEQREPIEYVVFRSTTSPTSHFRQVSPILRAPGYLDTDVLPGRTYYYQTLAFDPVTKELVGYTDPVQSASFGTLTPVGVQPVPITIANVTFYFNLNSGETATFPVTLDPGSKQQFAATGSGTITLTVAGTAGGQTAVLGSKTATVPSSLVLNLGSQPQTYQLSVTAVGGPAKGLVYRTGTAGGGITIITLPEALKSLHLIPLGAKAVIPQPDGTLTEVVKGDLNGDGKITVSDVVLELESTVGLLKLDPIQAASADANGDGKITVQDAIAALRFAVGLTP